MVSGARHLHCCLTLWERNTSGSVHVRKHNPAVRACMCDEEFYECPCICVGECLSVCVCVCVRVCVARCLACREAQFRLYRLIGLSWHWEAQFNRGRLAT